MTLILTFSLREKELGERRRHSSFIVILSGAKRSRRASNFRGRSEEHRAGRKTK